MRFRHMTTRYYLCITSDRRVSLISDWKDPRTVFRLHPVIKVGGIQMNEITDDRSKIHKKSFIFLRSFDAKAEYTLDVRICCLCTFAFAFWWKFQHFVTRLRG